MQRLKWDFGGCEVVFGYTLFELLAQEDDMVPFSSFFEERRRRIQTMARVNASFWLIKRGS